MRRVLAVKETDAIIGLNEEQKCDSCNATIFNTREIEDWRWVQDGILHTEDEKCHLICKSCLVKFYNYDSRNFNRTK